MITLSSELVEGLKEEAFNAFKDEAREHLEKVFKHLNQQHSKESKEAFLDISLKRGEEKFFLKKEAHFLDYLEVNARLGIDFESDTFYVPFAEFISQYVEKTNTLSSSNALYFLNLYEYEYPRVSNEKYIEIFEKLYFEPFKFKTLTGVMWIEVLKKYLPNKESHFLDKELAVERLKEANERVSKYGFQTIKSTIIYHLLSFKFGIGLDINPLYPKFQEILIQKHIDEEKKNLKLLEQGIKYLKEELGEEISITEEEKMEQEIESIPLVDTNNPCPKSGYWKPFISQEFGVENKKLEQYTQYFYEGDIFPRLFESNVILNTFLRWQYVGESLKIN